MILCFPNLDTLRMVVSSGLIPAEMLQATASLGELPGGGYAVESAGKLTKKIAGELAKLNVATAKGMPAASESLSCWYQILPLIKESAGVPLATQTPVLFELDSPADLTALVGEMLRLGNDRQSFRWMQDAGTQKILLRVIGPPYYTMLRAIDQLPTEAGGRIRAYIEQSPRFWVQLGYRHPLADSLQTPDDRCVLVRPPRDWTYLAEAPFRDAYEILDFQLPAAPTDWQTVREVPKFEVPLSLVPGNAADAAELWVLREGAQAQLDAFVRDADERLIQRLRFAVTEGDGGNSRIVLRVAPSKLPLPVLTLPGGFGFKPYQKLPNLFLPVGQRLHPQLRRDAVRTLLSADTNRCVWLMPRGKGEFVPESISEEAFRPLEDWVEYQIGLAHEPLKAWIAGMQFDFQSFQCSDTGSPRPKNPPDERSNKTETSTATIRTPSEAKDRSKSASPETSADPQPYVPEQKAPGEWHKLRLELQTKFLNTEGSLDDPGKKSLWPALARANSGVGDTHEAALCWLSALWEYEKPAQELIDGWRHSEGITQSDWGTPAYFNAMQNRPNPSSDDFRRFACLFFALAIQPEPPRWLKPLLPEVQRYFEANDAAIPIRAAWLVGVRLARLSGGDALGLARLRDRLLERLIEHGLNPEIDLPFFLRNSESDQSETLRFIRTKTAELHKRIKRWSESAAVAATAFQTRNNAQTAPYIDLLFAYTLARLGENRAARALLDEARTVMTATANEAKFGIAREFLFRAFQSRIELAIGGKPNRGPLEPELLKELERMYRQSQNVDNSPEKMAFYVISRMREESRILEPLERIATYEKLGNIDSEFQKLEGLTNGHELAAEIRRLLRSPASQNLRYLTTLLKTALPLAHRAGETFAIELIQQIPKALALGRDEELDADLLAKRAAVLEHGLFLSAHYDRRDSARKLLELVQSSFQGINGDSRTDYLALVARQSLKTLRRLGLLHEGQSLLEQLQTHLLNQQPLEQWRTKYASDPKRWVSALQALLALAGGHLRFRMLDRALPVLDLAREELLARTTKQSPKDFAALAQAYIAAVGQAEPEFGLARIAELFEKMNPALVTVTYTTAAFYSRLHLNLVEETVLAIIGDDSGFGATGQRWLEDDEFLVRRQIHRDMKWLLHHAGA